MRTCTPEPERRTQLVIDVDAYVGAMRRREPWGYSDDEPRTFLGGPNA